MKREKKVVSLRVRTVCIIVFVSLFFCLIAALMSKDFFTKTNEDNYRDYAEDLVKTVADFLEPQDIAALRADVGTILTAIPDEERVTSSEMGSEAFEAYLSRFASVRETEEYHRTKAVLERIRKENIAESIYVWYTQGEEKQIVYLADAAQEQYLPGVIDPLYEHNWYILNNPQLGITPYITKTEMYGWLCTAATPILSENGNTIAYVGVDIRMNDVKAAETRFSVRLAVALIIITVVVIVIYLFLLNRMIIKPINLLADAASHYGEKKKGDGRHVFSELDISTRDEIGHLAQVMCRMEEDMDDYTGELTRMTAEQERMDTELEVAEQILEDMLPSEFPAFPDRPEFDIYAKMRPQAAIGADAYDYFLLDDTHLVTFITDVSEQGIPAALFMMKTDTLIRARTRLGGTPAEILNDVNRELCENNNSDIFVTAWLGILDLKTGEAIAANAGHEYPVRKRIGEEYELLRSSHFPPLGTSKETQYEDVRTSFCSGDAFFLYTDGVSEAKNEDGKRFTALRMIDVLNAAGDADVKEMVDAVDAAVQEFTGTAEPYDDITMLAVRYFGREKKK